MGAMIRWGSVEIKYNVNEMTWAQFTDEFNEYYFNVKINREYWDQFNNLQREIWW